MQTAWNELFGVFAVWCIVIFIVCPPQYPVTVFTLEEVDRCGRIRTPSLINANGTLYVFARCCGQNLCSIGVHHVPEVAATPFRRRMDDDSDATVVFKRSFDHGRTWVDFTTLSPHGAVGYANVAAIFDEHRRRIVVQYNEMKGHTTDPAYNASLFQMWSDDGVAWSAPRDITHFIDVCNPDIRNTQVQSAGSKLQTASGRIIFAGHRHRDSLVCVWYSDDGGDTYTATLTNATKEVSITEVFGRLYMNGRSGPSQPRHDLWSDDDGATWTGPFQSSLWENDPGCERSLLTLDDKIYTMAPRGPHRTDMVLQCSEDGAQTWPHVHEVNGWFKGGYSALAAVDSSRIMAVWEDGHKPGPFDAAAGNIFAQMIRTDFCTTQRVINSSRSAMSSEKRG